MKQRFGFVSNSSSSSYVIIGSRDDQSLDNYILGGVLDLHDSGCSEFGWGPDTITDIESKVTMCQILAGCRSPSYQDMLLDAIKRKHPKVEYIIPHESGYVDHQSAAELFEVFESIDVLYDFIFGSDSRIELDNDNH